MRYVHYPSIGKPQALTQELDELVMLLQASIEIANAERWALEIGDAPIPASLQANIRRNAYEVTVVDALHRVARRYFDQHGHRAVWERTFQTGKPGRPESIDISLFNDVSHTETRVELGLYSKLKLREDARKLARLVGTAADEYPGVQNLLILWEITEKKLTRSLVVQAMSDFKTDAASLQIDSGQQVIKPLLASGIDLFVGMRSASRCATVGLFKLVAA
jgi:hypothetical protein